MVKTATTAEETVKTPTVYEVACIWCNEGMPQPSEYNHYACAKCAGNILVCHHCHEPWLKGEQHVCTSSLHSNTYYQRGYNNNAKAVRKVADSTDLLLGVELETNRRHLGISLTTTGCILLKALDNRVYCKTDGTITGHEIASDPMVYEEQAAVWSKWLSFKHHQFEATSNCGLHVHVNRRAITPFQIGKTAILINHRSNEKLIRTIAGRYNGSYHRIYHEVGDMKLTGNKSDERAYNDGMVQRGAFHAGCLPQLQTGHGTVEFRLFASTLDKTVFLARLQSVLAMLEFADISSPDEMRTPQFLDFLTTREEKFPDLKALLKGTM